MSDHYSAVSEESNSDLKEQDSKQLGLLKETSTPKQSSENTSQTPLFMTTLRRLIGEQFQRLTCSPEDSHAKTSAMLERELESKGIVLHSGSISVKRLAHCDQDTHSLKTSQLSLVEGLMSFSATLPRSGMMRNGIVYQLPPLVRITRETESSSWPTPTAIEVNLTLDQIQKRQEKYGGKKRGMYLSNMVVMKNSPMFRTPTVFDSKSGGKEDLEELKKGNWFRKSGVRRQLGLNTQVRMWPTPHAVASKHTGPSEATMVERGFQDSIARAVAREHHQELVDGLRLNPPWVEWLMGFPIGWTELDALETLSFRNAQKSLREQLRKLKKKE